MKRTENILQGIREFLNTNEEAQKITETMAKRAEELNFTADQWEQAKIGFMTSLFYRLALDHDDIKAEVAADVYEMFNAEA